MPVALLRDARRKTRIRVLVRWRPAPAAVAPHSADTANTFVLVDELPEPTPNVNCC
jgi:hypothetical protein